MSLNSYSTKDDAMTREIIEPIEAGGVVQSAADEYDLEAIFDEVMRFDSALQRFIPVANPSEFWSSVDRHAK